MGKENFFDFREKLGAKSPPPAPSGKTEPLTVTQLTAQIEKAIKTGVPGTVHVRGEVSNFNQHRASGHLYFTLKDPNACIDCVMFRSDAARLKFAPADGMELLAGGRVAVYPQRGRYQLYVTSLHPLGQGALELAFRQLCEKLEKEGLFAPERKKSLPKFPTSLALVTSRSTAALQDMLKVLRRYPWIKLSLFHVPVQGDGSAERIAEAIRLLNEHSPLSFDAILLGRGGGSLEDLWEFNEEIVARAIVASRIPVVTGIGHEVDTSIADLVADYHAHTPTEAAQVITANWRVVVDLIETSGLRLGRGLRNLVSDRRQRLTAVARHEFFRRPTDRINQLRQYIDDRQRSLLLAINRRLHDTAARLARCESKVAEAHPRHRLDLSRQRIHDIAQRLTHASELSLKRRAEQLTALESHLQAVSPQSVLKRGYSITTRRRDGSIVRSARQVRVGERIVTQFADGKLESTVEDQQQLPLFE